MNPFPLLLLGRRASRGLASVAAIAVAAVGLSACQSQDADYRAVEADLARTAVLPKQFVWIHQTLSETQSVGGEFEDPYRYDVLYSEGGQSAWEEIVRDDAVADRLLNPLTATAFLSRRGSATASSLSPGGAGAVGTTGSSGSTPSSPVVAALLARHWVVDPTGAPATPSVGNEVAAEKIDPFYASLVFLQDIEDLITAAPSPQVRRWRRNDVQPVYKPTDDPFPAPPAGVTRYDVLQQPLPVLTSNSPGGVPAPPTLASLVKVAIYVHQGRVVQIREVVDPVDQLQALVNNYHLKLPKHLSRAGQEAFAQKALTQMATGATGPPIQIGQTVWIAYDLGQPQTISLPADAYQANLSVLPGRGTKQSPRS